MARTFAGPDWTTPHAAKWTNWLQPLIGQPNVAMLQIGAYEGRSSVWFRKNILTGDGAILTDVDPWWNADAVYQRYVGNVEGLGIVTIRAPFATAYAQLVGKKFAAIYDDGDHAAANCLADGCMAWHLLEPGGVLIFDDYAWTSRKRPIPPGIAIDAFLRCYADRILGYEVGSDQVCVWKPPK